MSDNACHFRCKQSKKKVLKTSFLLTQLSISLQIYCAQVGLGLLFLLVIFISYTTSEVVHRIWNWDIWSVLCTGYATPSVDLYTIRNLFTRLPLKKIKWHFKNNGNTLIIVLTDENQGST